MHYVAEGPNEQERVARAVRRRRRELGWTLDVAAARLGVSRRLLAQVEAGTANPSLSSLLAIAAGFGVPLADLLSDVDPPPVVIGEDNATAPVLWTGPDGGTGRLLVASGGLELWEWVLQPGECRRSDAHRRGAREALTVAAGELTVTLAGAEPVVVTAGQSAAFAADVAHEYANLAPAPTRFALAVHETS